MALQESRKLTNEVAKEIRMKLHPQNKTPGFDPKPVQMLIYRKHQLQNGGALYDCYMGFAKIGTIAQEADGFYYFWPEHNEGMWSEAVFRDLAFKLESLNQKVPEPKPEDDVEPHPFTD